MGDGDHRLAFHQAVQAFLNGRFHFRVQCRGSFVQHQDRRVLEQHAGDGNALTLAAGQLDAAFTDLSIHAAPALAVIEGGDEGIGAGLAYCLPELVVAGIGFAVAQVVTDRTVQQGGVLGHHADVGAQAFLSHRGDVLIVDQDASAFQVVQAQQQVDQGRLAGAGRADQTDFLARCNGDVQAADHAALLAIVEVDVLETHTALRHLQRFGICAVEHLAWLNDALHAVLHGADVLEDAVDHPHDPFGHVVDANHQAQRQGDGAGGDQ